MTTQYLPFDLEAALEDQRRGKPCRIVRLNDGARAMGWGIRYSKHVPYSITIYWDDAAVEYNIHGDNFDMHMPAIGLMPEMEEVYVRYNPVTKRIFQIWATNKELRNLNERLDEVIDYKITLGSDPQIEIVK